jgi:hypothetical protein
MGRKACRPISYLTDISECDITDSDYEALSSLPVPSRNFPFRGLPERRLHRARNLPSHRSSQAALRAAPKLAIPTEEATQRLRRRGHGGGSEDRIYKVTPHDADPSGGSVFVSGRTGKAECPRSISLCYDFRLKWLPEGQPDTMANAADSPGLFTALREQLGLEFKADRGPVEFLIIDSAEKPFPN